MLQSFLLAILGKKDGDLLFEWLMSLDAVHVAVICTTLKVLASFESFATVFFGKLLLSLVIGGLVSHLDLERLQLGNHHLSLALVVPSLIIPSEYVSHFAYLLKFNHCLVRKRSRPLLCLDQHPSYLHSVRPRSVRLNRHGPDEAVGSHHDAEAARGEEGRQSGSSEQSRFRRFRMCGQRRDTRLRRHALQG